MWRRTGGALEWLVLHRSHFSPEFTGDWAWTPPAGALDPGETALQCAQRELREEAGLELTLTPTDCGDDDVTVFHAEAPAAAEIKLSAEHDAYRWLPLAEAAALCLPGQVGRQLACVGRIVA